MGRQRVVGFYVKDGKTRPLTQRNARGYTANKKQTMKHVSKYTPERIRFAEETSKLDNWQNHNRIDDYMKDPQTRDMATHFEPFVGQNQVKPIVAEPQQSDGSYSTGKMLHGEKSTCPSLSRVKAQQRGVLASRMRRGTVLELYAGRGNLSRAVYAPRAKRMILVDKDAKALRRADRKLDGRVRHQVYAGDNRRWVRNQMSQAGLKDLSLVDFDAFGRPTEIMTEFFNNYKVRRPLYVAVTDGAGLYYGQNHTARARASALRGYHLRRVPRDLGTTRGQVEMLSSYMKEEGRRHRFRVEPVSIAKNRHKTIYAGYLLKPA